jgi:hypothetical protein
MAVKLSPAGIRSLRREQYGRRQAKQQEKRSHLDMGNDLEASVKR